MQKKLRKQATNICIADRKESNLHSTASLYWVYNLQSQLTLKWCVVDNCSELKDK